MHTCNYIDVQTLSTFNFLLLQSTFLILKTTTVFQSLNKRHCLIARKANECCFTGSGHLIFCHVGWVASYQSVHIVTAYNTGTQGAEGNDLSNYSPWSLPFDVTHKAAKQPNMANKWRATAKHSVLQFLNVSVFCLRALIVESYHSNTAQNHLAFKKLSVTCGLQCIYAQMTVWKHNLKSIRITNWFR